MKNLVFSDIFTSFIRFRTSHGFGVHSPFAFKFIADVLKCDHCYYSFQWLDKLIIPDLLSQHSSDFFYKDSIKVKRYYHFLFKIANYFDVSTVFAPRIPSALPVLYLTAHKKNSKAFVPELSFDFSFLTKVPFNPDKISVFNFDKGLQCLPDNNPSSFDLLYFSIFLSSNDAEDLFSLCLLKVNNNSVLIIEGIHSSEDRHSFWNRVCCDSSISVTMDMKDFGIAFFSSKLHPKNYKLFF